MLCYVDGMEGINLKFDAQRELQLPLTILRKKFKKIKNEKDLIKLKLKRKDNLKKIQILPAYTDDQVNQSINGRLNPKFRLFMDFQQQEPFREHGSKLGPLLLIFSQIYYINYAFSLSCQDSIPLRCVLIPQGYPIKNPL